MNPKVVTKALIKNYIVMKECCHEGHANPSAVMKDYIVKSQIRLWVPISVKSSEKALKGTNMDSI